MLLCNDAKYISTLLLLHICKYCNPFLFYFLVRIVSCREDKGIGHEIRTDFFRLQKSTQKSFSKFFHQCTKNKIFDLLPFTLKNRTIKRNCNYFFSLLLLVFSDKEQSYLVPYMHWCTVYLFHEVYLFLRQVKVYLPN